MNSNQSPSLRYKQTIQHKKLNLYNNNPNTIQRKSRQMSNQELITFENSNLNSLAYSFEKQNNNKLSFSNLKYSVRPGSLNCEAHPLKKAKYKECSRETLHCMQCAVQLASRGIKLQELQQNAKKLNLSKIIQTCLNYIQTAKDQLQNQFQEAKVIINKQIKINTQYYASIIEKISDMQLQDLIQFQQALQNNQKQFEMLNIEHQQYYQKVLSLRNINQKDKDSAKQICNQVTNKISQLIKHKFSFLHQEPIVKDKLERINTILQGLKLKIRNPNTSMLSQLLKSASTFDSKQQQKKQKSIQDTPQHLKRQIDLTKSIIQKKNNIKFMSNIDFCESMVDKKPESFKNRYNDEQINE